ncbi:hypothetical protein [Allokutzneria albata]|uniref:hypothetical protein n=1 Tax=Allokutzneria albata TaxID=211114 RepID=UPI0012DC5445|nr:hypothetical protein [Allokutzneria albata]
MSLPKISRALGERPVRPQSPFGDDEAGRELPSAEQASAAVVPQALDRRGR